MGLLFSLIWFLLIGLIAGWLASRITGGRELSALNYMLVGALGSIVGGFLFRLLGLGAVNIIGSLLTATVGAIVVLYLLRQYGRKV